MSIDIFWSTMNVATSLNESIIQLTLINYIYTLNDVLLLIEACRSETLNYISRFSEQNEVQALVSSKNIFVYADFLTDREHWNNNMSWTLLELENKIIQYEHNDFNALIKRSETLLCQQIYHYFVFYYWMNDIVNEILRWVLKIVFISSKKYTLHF